MSQADQFDQLLNFFTAEQATALVQYVDSIVQPCRDDSTNLSLSLSNAISNLIPAQPPSVSQPSRALNVDFTIDPLRNSLIFYTVSLTTSLGISGTDSAQVDLLIDGIITSTVQSSISLVLGLLSLTQSQSEQQILCGYVPGGSTVHLTTSGTETAVLVQCLEVLI